MDNPWWKMDILSPINAAIVLIFGVMLCYGLFQCVYLAFFHPLAKVPGPKLYSISQLPYIYHLACGDWPQTLKKFHDRYGAVIRFGPSDVSFTTADAWKQIYGHKNAGEKTFDKDRRIYRPSLSGYDSIITANDADHRRMRRLLSHAFSEKALREQEDVMKQYIDLLITGLREQASNGAVVDIVRWYNFTTFDLIGDLAFGESFGCLKSGGYHPWVAMIFDGVRMASYTQAVRRLPSLIPLAGLIIPKKIMRSSREHWQLSENTAKRRIESGNTDRADFMSYILRHNDEKGMIVGEIVENANTLIIAGSETTATQLSGTTFNLLTNHDAYDKLVKEIRTSFDSEDEITISRVNNLEYLIAALNESFRMYPPVPIGLSRITPKGGELIEGYWIPENTAVSVPQWSTYQSERNWLEPQKYIPERWLDDPRFAHDVKVVLNPFSLGPRNCIGKNLAYAEMRLILARVLWNFDLEIMPDCIEWNQQDVFTLWNKSELRIKLTQVQREARKVENEAAGGVTPKNMPVNNDDANETTREASQW